MSLWPFMFSILSTSSKPEDFLKKTNESNARERERDSKRVRDCNGLDNFSLSSWLNIYSWYGCLHSVLVTKQLN